MRRPGRDQHALALEIEGPAQEPAHRVHDLRDGGQTPLSHFAAGQLAASGRDDAPAVRAQELFILLINGIGVHLFVHGRAEEEWRSGGEKSGCKSIIRKTVGGFGDGIGRRWADDETVRPARPFDVHGPSTQLAGK